MSQPDFRLAVMSYFDQLRAQVETGTGDWTVKGFIDIYQRIYTISLDTKVLSKVLELVMFPVIYKFAQEFGFRLELARQQNHYPDLTLISPDGEYFAVDVKTTYRAGVDRLGQAKVNGMTLGTYQGYFRDRTRAITSTYPYNTYAKHFVLGVIYDQALGVDERKTYSVTDLQQIPSVAKNFDFFLQEKYRIAADRAGSGNTKNIGSSVFLDRLINGTGVFAELGVDIFDDYWMNYRTRAMAVSEGFKEQPYRNLLEYKKYKQQGAAILNVEDVHLQSENVENDVIESEQDDDDLT